MNMPSLCKLPYTTLRRFAWSLLLIAPLTGNAADKDHCANDANLAENVAGLGTHQEFLHYLNDIIAEDEFSRAPAVFDPALLARSAKSLRVCPQAGSDQILEERIAIEALHNVASAFISGDDSSPEIFYQQYGLEKMLLAEIHLLKSGQKPLVIDWQDGGQLRSAFARHYAPKNADDSDKVATY